MIVDALRKNPNLRGVGVWLANHRGSASQETGNFLERCLSRLDQSRRTEVLKVLGCETAENVDAALYELVAHELFTRLGWTPTFKPAYTLSSNKKLTPDMDVAINGREFVVEVFLTYNAVRTVRPEVAGFRHTVDAGENTKKIYDAIKEKCGKYGPIQKPVMLVAFLADQDTEPEHVQEALYGARLGDGWLKRNFPFGIADFQRSKSIQGLPGGAMLPSENDVPGCANLSAVLACDWLDALDRRRPGKRLYCAVLHHWKPDVPIPAGKFGKFPEVVWCRNSSNYYEWKVINSRDTVASFAEGDLLEFGNDSVQDPWC